MTDRGFHDPLWDDYGETPMQYQARKAREGNGYAASDTRKDVPPDIPPIGQEIIGSETAPLEFTPLSDWHGQPIPIRQWGVADRVPAKNVTLLSGEGGVGKTLVLQQLGIATVAKRDWFGVQPAPGPFMGLFCEDDQDEIHRRFDDIAGHYDVPLSAFRDLHIRTMAGEDAILAALNRSGLIQPTELYSRLLAAAVDIRPSIIALDNAADIYAGNENDRQQVRQFVGLLRRTFQHSGIRSLEFT